MHYVWAVLSRKNRGRSRPNRGFRPRPIFMVRRANVSDGIGFARRALRTQVPQCDQNTACDVVFCFFVHLRFLRDQGENEGLLRG
jgi:hypothetical protein